MSLFPALYDSFSTSQRQATNASQLAAEGLYLELVRVVTDSIPRHLQDLVQEQLMQLNAMHISDVGDAASLQLQGDQYRVYTAITASI